MNIKEKRKRTKSIGIAAIALVSILLATCMTAAPAMAAQEEIVWQCDAIMPWDAERLSNNNTLITEYGNHTVIEVTPLTKEIIYGNGTFGSGANQLNCPIDAERLSDGKTLITDSKNHRVIEVDSNKNIVWQYGNGTLGAGINQLKYPMDAERLANGNTLITDEQNSRVIEVRTDDYDPTEPDNNFSADSIVWQYGTTGVAGSGPNELNYPKDADRLANGNTIIADYRNHRVIEVNTTGEKVWQCGTGTPGSGVNQLNNPTDAERLPSHNTLITDHSNHRVIVVNPANKIVWQYGTGIAGSDANELWNPTDAERLSNGNTLIADKDNTRVIEVSVITCWDDTFDDETKIAEMQHVVVSDGDVTIDLENIPSFPWSWRSDSSASGLPSDYFYSRWGDKASPMYKPAIAFNIKGDGRWNLIAGHSSGEFLGFYWNGTQWISDSSLVAGLEGAGSRPAPAIAFNIKGDGRWNLIAGNISGEFNGFYWNGLQWISDSSLVAGLGDVGVYSAPAIAFNTREDGMWNLISGNGSGEFNGFYWERSQWVSDPSLVSGLGDVGDYSAPAIAFDLTWKGKWNLVSGFKAGWQEGGTLGYYWNGTQWIRDSSLDTLVKAARPKNSYQRAPAIAFNITGDGGWNMICGEYHYHHWNSHYGALIGYALMQPGNVKSVVIPLSNFKNMGIFDATDTLPRGTSITYKVLDWNDNTIMSVVPGQDISDISQFSIRLLAELTTVNPSYTPVLHDWVACWETGEVDLVPTTIVTPSPMYENVATIGAVIANIYGDAHSGGFNAALYANGTEVDTKFINDIPPGESMDVMFLGWTPPHAGTYNLTVIVDSDDGIVETNEGNNELTKEVTVLPTSVRRLTFDPSSSGKPNTAADNEGNLHLVRYDDLGDGSGLYYRKLAPDGTVLVDDKMVSPGSGSRIAVDSSDNVHVVFNNGTNSINVSYVKLDNLGNMLIEPKQVISAVYNQPANPRWLPAKPCGIAVDGSGNVHVVACCNCGRLGYGDRQDLKYVKLDNEGNKLVNYTIEHLTTPGASGTWACMAEPSGIAVDSAGNAYTAYSKGSCGAYGAGTTNCWWPSCLEAYYVKIDSEGVHKQELTSELPGLPCPSLYPSVCVDSGDNKYVVWSQHNRTATIVPCGYVYCRILYGFDFYLTKFDKSDNKVIDRKRLTFEDYPVESADSWPYYVHGVRRPIIATESGVIHAAWSVPKPKAGENGNIWYMAFDTSGDEIINKTLISLEDGDSWEPDIDACSDGSHLVWTDNRDGNNEIYYAKTVPPPNRVFVLAPADQWTPQNIVTTYTIGILSTMPNTEMFNLKPVNLDHAGVAELSNLTITLEPYSVGEVTLNVTDSRVGDYRVTVTATSKTNSAIQDSATITTSVIVPTPDLVITAIDAYHNDTGYPPYFNLSNEVNVTVKNIGTGDTGAFNVGLYANDTWIDSQSVSGLGIGMSETVQLKWTPTGIDCDDGGTKATYTLKAIADCDKTINEMDETNNEGTAEETVYWAGYSADEELIEASHGVIRGGLLYTTGDGGYVGLYTHGSYKDTQYNIELPANSSVKHARLNVYYTWSKHDYPVMEVSINEIVVPPSAHYNDRPCESPAIAYEYPWGNYVYNLTSYITDSGSYTVRVKNNGSETNQSNFCIAAPGLVILYEDNNMPEYEYWILEGADVVEGGRRGGAGYLSLEDCTNDAVFPRSIDLGNVASATLGMVSVWGGAAWGELTSYYWFNENYLGEGGNTLFGYGSLYNETIDGISMFVGASGGAQVGANVSDVTDYIVSNANVVSFGDDGDSMMPTNAFLLVERCRTEKPEPAVLVPFMVSGYVFNYSDETPINNPDVTIKNLNTGEALPTVETHNDSNYYQVLTSVEKVSCGDVLRFRCNGTSVKHRVRQSEIDAGGFEQNCMVGLIEAIEAGVTFSPKKLDLNSSGVLKAYITLPEGYDVANISVSTVECEGAPVFGFGKVIPGKQALEVKFEIQNLTVPTGPEVLLTVTGELYDGTPFEASNTVKVV